MLATWLCFLCSRRGLCWTFPTNNKLSEKLVAAFDWNSGVRGWVIPLQLLPSKHQILYNITSPYNTSAVLLNQFNNNIWIHFTQVSLHVKYNFAVSKCKRGTTWSIHTTTIENNFLKRRLPRILLQTRFPRKLQNIGHNLSFLWTNSLIFVQRFHNPVPSSLHNKFQVPPFLELRCTW